jgi:Ca2+-binding RTX toxin-like protein
VTGDGSVGTDTIIGGVFNVLGSNANDTITGSASADTLNGNGGNDIISGLGGNDGLTGGLGSDTFVYANGGGADTITDFNRAEGDKIDVTGVSGIFTLADIQARASQQGPNTLIDFGAGNTITLYNITVGSLVASDFVFNNVVMGTSSGETLVGTSQIDGIFGLDGNDRLQGLGGNDTLDGGNGFDRAIYTDATGGVAINLVAGTASGAGVGIDTLVSIEGVVGSDFADTFNTAGFNAESGVPGAFPGLSEFEGRGGDDTIIGAVNVSGQILTRLSYVNETAFVTVDIQAGTADGTSTGHDTFTNVNAIIGSALGDTLRGSDNASNTFEQFDGRGGNDLIDGRGGYDFANYSGDVVSTGIAVNLAAGTVTGDPVIGLDTLRSIEGIRGTNLADTYDATGFGAGSTNAGSLGTFNNFDGQGGDDTITGNGNTRLQYTNSLAAVTVDIANGLAYGTAAGDVAQVGTDHFTGVNAALGSMFDDTMLGGAGNDNFTGLAGNDFVNGGNGFDTAIYNNLTYTTAGISVLMAAGTVTGIDSSVGTDTLRSIEGVQGTFFADTYNAVNFGAAGFVDPLNNNVGNNGTFSQFEGMSGNDTITGNGNTRVLYTNAAAAVTVDLALGTGHGTAAGDVALVGTDTFVSGVNSAQGSAFDDSLSGAVTNDSFVGLAGNDFLDGRDGFDTAIYNINTTAGIGVNLATGIVTGLDASVGTDTLRNIEGVQGTNFNDTFTAAGYGLAGADNVSSTQGSSNTFQGNAGDDTVTGNGSTVVVFTNSTGNVAITIGAGGSGSSTGDTSVGTDSFTGGVNGAVGGNFDDTYNASAFSGFNTFQGNAGNDTITGNGNTEIQYSNSSGSVNVNLSTGSVTGNPSVGTDAITGGVSRVFGSNSADTITGTSASEALNGNGGNDSINGGGGADALTGGAGNDNFVFAAGLTNGATITDFNGNGAGVGDSLEFHGFGTAAQGATLTWISGTQWQVHSGLDSHNEIITLTGNGNGALHASDYQFLT